MGFMLNLAFVLMNKYVSLIIIILLPFFPVGRVLETTIVVLVFVTTPVPKVLTIFVESKMTSISMYVKCGNVFGN